MKQLTSLLKAVMTQDMKIFKYKASKNATPSKKLLFPLMLSLILMFSIGTFFYMFAFEFSKFNLTYIMLTLALIIPVILTLIGGMYKSQGILFESKDNDLLFSLPIKKSRIIMVRLIKLYVFQFIYDLLFILPAYVIYAFFENPSINFYVVSAIMALLLPIIPMIVSCFIGFLIKNVSSKFKSKKFVQTVLTMIILVGVMLLSFNMNNLIGKIIENANSVNDVISKIYYPIGLYINLINEFNIIEMIKLILINVIPLALFVAIVAKYYFSIISKSVEKTSAKNKCKVKGVLYRQRKPLAALTLKELKRFFSTPVYMLNTLFGLVIVLIATIGMCVNLEATLNIITEGEGFGIDIATITELMPKIFFGLIIFASCLTSITSSSISLEGKSFSTTKSLPVKSENILLGKIISSNLICIPMMLLCDIIFLAVYKPSLIDTISILLMSVIMPTFTAIIGLIINLKYPKMNATSDTEVVKQSMSSALAVLGGMVISVVLIGIIAIGIYKSVIETVLIAEVAGMAIITFILWKILQKYGVKRIKEIE